MVFMDAGDFDPAPGYSCGGEAGRGGTPRRAGDADAFATGRAGSRLGDEPQVSHAAQNVPAAAQGRVEVPPGVESRGALGNAGQKRRLPEGELRRALVEVSP